MKPTQEEIDEALVVVDTSAKSEVWDGQYHDDPAKTLSAAYRAKCQECEAIAANLHAANQVSKAFEAKAEMLKRQYGELADSINHGGFGQCYEHYSSVQFRHTAEREALR